MPATRPESPCRRRIWNHSATVSSNSGNSSEAPHNVLAAEEFAMPTVDPELHHGPITPPKDPSGITEPHDILAAEEFPMPATHPHETPAFGGSPGQRWLIGLAGLLALALVLRLRRR
jgi:hypothetical protein